MGRTSVDVRSAGPRDVELLLTLSAAAWAERCQGVDGIPAAQQPGQRTRLSEALSRPEVEVLLAEVGREPVGVLVLRRGELLPLCGSDAVHVEQLFVQAQWRRRGAARALLTAAATLGEQAGVEELACAVPAANRNAHRFLARLGFAPLVTQRVVPVNVLLRRLTGHNPTARRRSGLEQMLARRRREQGRVPVS